MYTVKDRGGAIKAAGQMVRNIRIGDKRVPDKRTRYDRLDLLFPSHSLARRFGRQVMNVRILTSGGTE